MGNWKAGHRRLLFKFASYRQHKESVICVPRRNELVYSTESEARTLLTYVKYPHVH